ncbi:hypothetical protein DQG23_10900 [Paenibacillus contaminans]|uniref:Uncharacterized protein n=1 Tax=Paenibacillus contaminans TaxID=450362 RepID=A0A329MPC0_9BACL|nr:hypothetical protein DQG23_10900 [Paenibacillus contaminans]
MGKTGLRIRQGTRQGTSGENPVGRPYKPEYINAGSKNGQKNGFSCAGYAFSGIRNLVYGRKMPVAAFGTTLKG